MSIKFKGKDYVLVNERVVEFRTNPNYAKLTIETEEVGRTFTELTGDIYKKGASVGKKTQQILDTIIFKCVIRKYDGVVISSGHAEEKRDSSFVNETSFVENCETSAVGRALGFLGIGIGDSIASADELVNAIKNQNSKKIENSIPTLQPKANKEVEYNIVEK